jgi:hypothetical protein
MRAICGDCAVQCGVRTGGGFLTQDAAQGRKATLNTWRGFDVWPANVLAGDSGSALAAAAPQRLADALDGIEVGAPKVVPLHAAMA